MEAETTTNVDSPCRELLLFAVDARKNMYDQVNKIRQKEPQLDGVLERG